MAIEKLCDLKLVGCINDKSCLYDFCVPIDEYVFNLCYLYSNDTGTEFYSRYSDNVSNPDEKIRGYRSEKPLDVTLMDRELLVPFLIPLYENIYNKCCKYNIAMKGFICCKEGVYVIDEQNNAHLVLFPNIELKDVVVKLSLMTLKG